ncbi:MAG: DUF4835 family protein [Bacteroidetes bacterium]|nr:DUF4835 family protein [Bacteroidota bacterium]
MRNKLNIWFKIITAIGLITLLATVKLYSQEFNVTVEVVNTAGQQTVDPGVFITLETSIKDFLSNTKWTTDNFKPSEKIDVVFVINITKELSITAFHADVTIQASRPVFNSDYNSVTFNWIDRKWDFEYTQYEQLLFQENVYLNNLTSLLAYYAYIIIGIDYDSFSMKGGNAYFLKAQNIVNNAQSSSNSGWKSHEDTRNRFWLIENFLNPNYEALREVLYKYHRLGLDIMYSDLGQGRIVIMESLTSLMVIYQDYPSLMIMTVFFAAKSDELANIFSKAPPAEKTKAIQLLSKMDASNTAKYKKILN